MILPNIEQNYPQIYISTEDGIYFNISFSEGASSYQIIDVDKDDIDSMIQDIRNQVELFQLYFQSSKPSTKGGNDGQ